MRLTIALSVVLFLCSFATNVFAKRYYPGIGARPIIVMTVPLQKSAGTYIFETDDLKPSSTPCSAQPDTQIVVRAPNGAVYQNDNALPNLPFKRSRVSFSSGTGTFTIYVFATFETRCGTTDLYLTEPGGQRVRVLDDVEFGSVPIQLSGLQAGKQYLFQTAHDPVGPASSQIMILSSNWVLKAEAHANGMIAPQRRGRAARIRTTYANGDRILVGSYGAPGSMALIIDDCFHSPDTSDENLRNECSAAGRDTDGDNLSDTLELGIGTNYRHWDTDHDGLNDYHELIGRATATGNVALRAMGANPLRRDLFLEVDSRFEMDTKDQCDQSTDPLKDPLSETAIEKVQKTLFNLPRLPPNPDRTIGIYLHVDRGMACNDASLCGDWGGSDNWGCTVGKLGPAGYYTESQATCKSGECDQAVFSPERWEIFRYALRWAGATGQTNGAFLFFNGSSGPSGYLAHELGHSMGLQHFGRPDLPSMNSKVNYPSIMNYYFQGRDEIGFSRGEMSAIHNLSISELVWSAGRDKSYLGDAGFRICDKSEECPGAANPSDAVDWNTDGRFTSGGVRFDISLPGSAIGGTGQTWPLQHAHKTFKLFSVENLAGIPMAIPRPAATGPALAYVQKSSGDYTPYAFYVTTAGELRYSNLQANSIYGTSWSKLDVSFKLATSGSTAAAVVPGFTQILIVHPEANTGKLGWAVFNTNSNSVTASGVIPGWPAGVQASNATLSPSTLVPAVMMVFRDSANGVWSAAYTFAGWGPISRALDESGTNLTSRGTPGLAQGSDGVVYLLRLPTDSDYLELFAGNGSTFAKVPDARIDSDINPRDRALWSRINLLYLPFLTGSGEEFADRSGYLAAFYELNNGPRWARAYLGGYIAPGGAHFTGIDAKQRNQYVVPNQKWGVSIAAARHGPYAGALYISEYGDDKLEYVPHANGIAPVAYSFHFDTNDAAVIDNGLCSVLKFRSCSTACSCQLQPGKACVSAPLLDKSACD